MGKLAGQDVAEDLGILMWMRGKACARSYSIFVEDAKRSKLLMLRMIVAGKAEGMFGIQPAMVGSAALG